MSVTMLTFTALTYAARVKCSPLTCLMDASLPALNANVMCGSCLKSLISTILNMVSMPLIVSTAWNLRITKRSSVCRAETKPRSTQNSLYC